MATTYVLISSNILSSSQTSVTFSSIPTTYTDLVLRSSVRHNGTGGNVWYFGAQFNSITGTVYSDTFLVTDSSSVIPTGSTNDNAFSVHAGTQVQNNYTADTFSNTELYIPNYRSSTDKPWSSHLINENNAGTYNYLGFCAGLTQTSQPITDILIKPNGSVGGFAAGSSFYLYGISST